MQASAWYVRTIVQNECTKMVYSMQVPELFIYLFSHDHYILYNGKYSFLYWNLEATVKWLQMDRHHGFHFQNLRCVLNCISSFWYIDHNYCSFEHNLWLEYFRSEWWSELSFRRTSADGDFWDQERTDTAEAWSKPRICLELNYLRLLKKSLKQRPSLVLVPRYVIFSNQWTYRFNSSIYLKNQRVKWTSPLFKWKRWNLITKQYWLRQLKPTLLAFNFEDRLLSVW